MAGKVKRKRGKKFRYFGAEGHQAKEPVENPFEDHSSSKKAQRDKLKVGDAWLNA
jgi:hypothetical protein